MIKVFYWCPFISEVATVKSVINSARSLKKYSKKNLEPYIINVADEWTGKKELFEKNKIKIIDLKNNNLIHKLPKYGFFYSRFSYFVIFFFSILKLHKILKKEQPEYLIIHLISFIPLILLSLFNYKTKFILRISGYPVLNILRLNFWKYVSKKIHFITTPTNLTLKLLKDKKVFEEKKILFLPDPVIDISEISNKKKLIKELEPNFNNKTSLLTIGRLTNQKNHSFLIRGFQKINQLYPDLNLFIIGNGEKKKSLIKLIDELNLSNKIFLLGYKENVFKYLANCKFFLLTSKFEDPGFVLLEAGSVNTSVLSSNCPNGPLEIIKDNQNGYLYQNNSMDDFINIFTKLYNEKELDIFKKKKNLKKKCKEFSIFQHFLKLSKILN